MTQSGQRELSGAFTEIVDGFDRGDAVHQVQLGRLAVRVAGWTMKLSISMMCPLNRASNLLDKSVYQYDECQYANQGIQKTTKVATPDGSRSTPFRVCLERNSGAG